MKTSIASTGKLSMIGAAAALSLALLVGGTANANPLALSAPQLDQVSAGGTNAYNGVSNSPAFEPSPYGSLQNANNTELRFGPGGGIAIPGQIPDSVSANAAVSPYTTGGSGGIVRPPSN